MKKIVCVFFTLLLLILPLCLNVGALDATYQVTVNYETDQIKTVTISINGGTPEAVSNGTPVNVPVSKSYTLTVTPKEQYTVEGIYNGTKRFENQNDTDPYIVTVSSITESVSLRIECKPITVKIVTNTPMTDKGESLSHYSPIVDGGSCPSSHTYGTRTLIECVPTISGYTFLNWAISTSKTDVSVGNLLKKNEDGVPYLDEETIYKTTIYLTPVFSVTQQDVYCFDVEYTDNAIRNHIGDELNKEAYIFQADFDSIATGLFGEERSYLGFTFKASEEYYTSVQVKLNDTVTGTYNVVYRLYLPNKYSLSIDAQNYETYTTTQLKNLVYVYNEDLTLPIPTRTGFRFDGYDVCLSKGGDVIGTIGADGVLYAHEEFIAKNAKEKTDTGSSYTNLILSARWVAETYSITYEGMDGATGENLPTTFVYDQTTAIGNPTKVGYAFKGWEVVGTSTTEKNLKLTACTYPHNITLKATWEPLTITVRFASTDTWNHADFTVKYDASPSLLNIGICPEKAGYKLIGFYTTEDGVDGVCCYDGEGKFTASTWKILGDNNVVTLYPVFGREKKTLTVNVTGDTSPSILITIPEYRNTSGVLVPLSTIPYEAGGVKVPYGLPLILTVTASNGTTITHYNGERLEMDTVSKKIDGLTVTEDTTVTLTVLPQRNALETGTVKVDYVDEQMNLPAGDYFLYYMKGDEVTGLSEYSVTAENKDTNPFVIPEDFYGQDIYVVCRGDGETEGDSSPLVVSLSARPTAPENPKEFLTSVTETGIVAMDLQDESDTYLVSFGTGEDDMSSWSEEENIKGLQPGVTYTFRFCSKAKDGEYPKGEIAECKVTVPADTLFTDAESTLTNSGSQYTGTFAEDTLNELLENLNKMKEQFGDGSNVSADLLTLAQSLSVDTTKADYLPTLMEAYVQEGLSSIALAGKRDESADVLRDTLESFTSTNRYGAQGVIQLSKLCEQAIIALERCTTAEEMKQLEESFAADAKAVSLNYWRMEGILLTVPSGLPYNPTISWTLSEEDMEDVVLDAIRAGNLQSGSGTETENQDEEWRTLSLLSYYVVSGEEDLGTSATITLDLVDTVPENKNIFAAFFKDGVLTVVKCVRNGNQVTVENAECSDLVLMVDSEMNFAGILLVMLLIAVLLGALGVYLVRNNRRKKKEERLNMAIPMLSVISFPAWGTKGILVMAVIIFIECVIVSVLLVKSKVERRKKQEPVEEDTVEAEELPTEETMSGADEMPLTEQTEQTETEPSEQTENKDSAPILPGIDDLLPDFEFDTEAKK